MGIRKLGHKSFITEAGKKYCKMTVGTPIEALECCILIQLLLPSNAYHLVVYNHNHIDKD